MAGEREGIAVRPIYGEPTGRTFGQVIGTLGIRSREQVRLLSRVLEGAMREYAGKHEETFLAKMHRDLVNLDRRAIKERWAGWSTNSRCPLPLSKEDGKHE